MEILNPRKRALFQKINYKPIPKAYPIHNSDSQIILMEAPSRSAKSSTCVPEALDVFMQKGKNIWVVAIDYKNTDRFIFGAGFVKGVYGFVKDYMDFLVNKRGGVHKKDHEIETRLGTTIKGKSAKYPDSFVAEPVDLIVCEDAVFFPEGFYDNKIRPRVVDTGGKILINTIPPLKTSNWVHQLSKNKNVFFTHWGLRDNTYLPEDQVDGYIQDCPVGLRRAFIDGLPPLDDSSIFGKIEDNIYQGKGIPYIEGHLYQAGMDIGFQHDRTVVTVSDLTSWQLVYMDIFPPKFFKTKLVEARLLNGLQKYNLPNCYVDISGIGEKFSDLVDSYEYLIGIRMYQPKIRRSIIDGLALAFARGYCIPNIQQFIDELENLDIIYRGANIIYKPKYFDDTIISTGLSIYGWSDKVSFTGKRPMPVAIEAMVQEDEFTLIKDEPPDLAGDYVL